MKTRTKAMLLTLCAVLLVTATIMGTLAYLTSTDEVQNTFTVGKVNIELLEREVDGNGQMIKYYSDDGESMDGDGNKYSYKWVKSNSYKLLPGHSYSKDPTIFIKAGSESCYVRHIITAKFRKDLTDEQKEWVEENFDIVDILYCDDYINGGGYRPVCEYWKRVGEPEFSEDGTSITYEYRYRNNDERNTNEILISTSEEYDSKVLAIFNEIRIPAEWDEDIMAIFEGFELNVVAEAIQADGFNPDDPKNGDAIWGAFDAQHNTEG